MVFRVVWYICTIVSEEPVAFETTLRAPSYTAWHPTRRQFLF